MTETHYQRVAREQRERREARAAQAVRSLKRNRVPGYSRVDAGTGREVPLSDSDWPNNGTANRIDGYDRDDLGESPDF